MHYLELFNTKEVFGYLLLFEHCYVENSAPNCRCLSLLDCPLE